jgi:ABC-type multidrug transport system fused ATPase/permease subunit
MKQRKFLPLRQRLQDFLQSLRMYQYCGRAVALVWATDRRLTIAVALLTLVAGLLPGVIAYVGKLIVDGVILAAQTGLERDRWVALGYLALEAAAVILLSACRQGLGLCQSLLRVLLGQAVNVRILEKALTLDMAHFEDSEFYDKMSRARMGASSRPLSLVGRTFSLVQDTIALLTFGGLLLSFSSWAVLILFLAAVPAFVAETRFSGEAFRLFRRKAPETREQNYLEWLLSNDISAMEIKLYHLGGMLLDRYRAIFDRLYRDDRNLTVRRSAWSYLLGLLSTVAFYSAYIWIVLEAIAKRISLGELTMYLMVFRQGQSTLANALSNISGMYEDSLYLSNLYEFLEQPIPKPAGNATRGPLPEDGLRFEQVTFTYPGNAQPALDRVSFQIRPGEKLAIVGENGSGKTTLIKLLTRLYVPDGGRILLDGLDLQAWDVTVLQERIGVIFQNFVRYYFTIGENIGVGDVAYLEDESRWRFAAEKGTANALIETLPEQYQTNLGRWFKDGRELSGGQWQKIALSRAFMRSRADILVLDEPTSAIDAEAEVEIFRHFQNMTMQQMTILISHRFSTVRMADQILVLSAGRVLEQGTHAELLRAGGRYAYLFSLQAAGYH